MNLRVLKFFFSMSIKHIVGIPMGAVDLPLRQIHAFRHILEDTLTSKVRFRGMEKSADQPRATVHLPVEAISHMDQPHITNFLNENDGVFLPGRRPRCPILDVWDSPSQHFKDATENTAEATFRFVELFAGIGGFRLGLTAVGGTCVLANELNPYAASVYREAFGKDELVEGDLLDIDTDNIPPYECLVGGFPCQPFTMRGDQPGFEDQRGQLYLEVARVLQDTQPACFILENVPGLVILSGGSRKVPFKGSRPIFTAGAVFEHILDVFRECGYSVDWQVLNSRKWLPQMRERVYMVGIRKDLCKSPSFFDWDPLLLHNLDDEVPGTVRDLLEADEEGTLKSREHRGNRPPRILQLDQKAPTLVSSYMHGESAYYVPTSDSEYRLLTPRECSRIMGFPETFPVPPVTDTAMVPYYYQAIGNAVCPAVITEIGKGLRACLDRRP